MERALKELKRQRLLELLNEVSGKGQYHEDPEINSCYPTPRLVFKEGGDSQLRIKLKTMIFHGKMELEAVSNLALILGLRVRYLKIGDFEDPKFAKKIHKSCLSMAEKLQQLLEQEKINTEFNTRRYLRCLRNFG